MSYTHLTKEERYQIFALRYRKLSARQIGVILKRHHSSISREIARNKDGRGYSAKCAHFAAIRRSYNCRNARIIDDDTLLKVQQLLSIQHSPEQISAQLCISHQTVYAYVLADKQAGGELWKNLRCKKKRRVPYGTGLNRAGQIANRRSITLRSPTVEDRKQVGHWEVDTIVGANHKQAIVSIVERKTGFTLLKLIRIRKASEVEKALCAMLKPFKAKVKTITSDNGKEFTNHESIARKIQAKWYFADPYCSWQRGCNENANGLVRQYIAKKRKLSSVTDEEVSNIEALLNSRPRKRLGYKTPEALFYQSLRRVALRN
jgi:transposase, IS30 family